MGVSKNKLGKVSGNLSAGGGMENKYELRGDLMQINSTFMTSIIGSANNSGSQIFSIEDYIRLQGGVNEFTGNQGQQSTVTLSEEERKLLIPRDNVYERNNGLAGMNFSYQPKNSFKINSYLLYSKNRESAEERNKYTYLLPEQRQYETSNSLNINNKNKLFSGFVKMNYQPSPFWNVAYKGQFSATGMVENTDAASRLTERQVHAAGYASATPAATKQNVAVMKSFNKHLFISEASFSYDNKPFSYEMQSDSLLLPIPLAMYGEYCYGRQNISQKNTAANIGFSFFYKINDSYFLRTGFSSTLTRQAYCSGIYGMNTEKEASLLPGEHLGNDYSLQMNDYGIHLNLTKNRGFFRFKAGASAHAYDFMATGISALSSRKVVKLNPALEMSLYFSDKHTLSLSGYESEHLLPPEAFLSGIVFDSYQSYGHNSRVNQWYDSKYNLSLSYRIFDMYYNAMLIGVGGYSRSNSAATINYYSDGLLTERNPVLSVPTATAYARLYASKGLGTIPWTLKLTGGYDENSFYNQSADKDNTVKVRNTTGKFQVVTNYRQILNIECKAELELIDNSSSLGLIKTQTIQRYSGKLKFNFNRRFWANVELEHIMNRSSNAGLYPWHLNALICYKLNDKTDINLSGQNMLHLKNQGWASVSYNGIYLAERNFRQIPGNLLLRLNYRF